MGGRFFGCLVGLNDIWNITAIWIAYIYTLSLLVTYRTQPPRCVID